MDIRRFFKRSCDTLNISVVSLNSNLSAVDSMNQVNSTLQNPIGTLPPNFTSIDQAEFDQSSSGSSNQEDFMDELRSDTSASNEGLLDHTESNQNLATEIDSAAENQNDSFASNEGSIDDAQPDSLTADESEEDEELEVEAILAKKMIRRKVSVWPRLISCLFLFWFNRFGLKTNEKKMVD